MAGKKKGPAKGRGPATRPPSPAKRTTVPKPAAGPKPPTPAKPAAGPAPSAAAKSAGGAKPAAAPRPAAAGPAPAPGKSAGAARSSGVAKPAAAPAKAAAKAAAPGKAVVGKAGPGQTAPAKGAAASMAAAPGKAAPGRQAPDGKGRSASTREERLAAAEAARRRRRIRNKALVAAGVVVTIFVIGFVVTNDRKARDQEAAKFQTGSCVFDRKSDSDLGPGRNHTPTPTYKLNPPAGGNHTPQASPPGIFSDANTPADGPTVHAMEHGYVVLWYRPDLDEAGLTSLRDLAQKHAKDVLMVPRPSLPTPVAATAWHARVSCGGVEAATIEQFITTFVNHGPEKVPH